MLKSLYNELKPFCGNIKRIFPVHWAQNNYTLISWDSPFKNHFSLKGQSHEIMLWFFLGSIDRKITFNIPAEGLKLILAMF